MEIYSFNLTLMGVEELTGEIIDRLFEAGCGDATFSTCEGVHYATFHRAGKNFSDAIVSVGRTIERAGVGLKVVELSNPKDQD